MGSVSYRGWTLNTTDANSYTFSSVDIGTAAADRTVIVAVHGGGAWDCYVYSATIGGVSATVAVTGNTPDDHTAFAAIISAPVPTGTTANIVINLESTQSPGQPETRLGIAVYAAYGLASQTPTDTAIHSSYLDAGPFGYATNSTISDLTVQGNGFAILVGNVDTYYAGHTWTGVTSEDYDQGAGAEAPNAGFTGATYTTSTTQTPSFNVSWGTSDGYVALGAAWKYAKTVFITTTGAGTYQVPADYSSLVSIECIGGGGGGCASGGGSQRSGGGGGAYAKITSLSLVALTTYNVFVGTGGLGYASGGNGGSGGNGANTWFSTTGVAPTSTSEGVRAHGGTGGVNQTGGAGGATASSIGSTTAAGGKAGNATNTGWGGTGGGGAAGPNGAGKDSVADTAQSGGTGGGAADGGAVGLTNSVANGGNGGAAFDATAGGTGGTGSATAPTAGTAGSHGSGGGGGGAHITSGNVNGADGGAGGAGINWTQTAGGATAGPGGGGGASGGSSVGTGVSGVGGDAGLYGGGGGASGDSSPGGPNGRGGNGAQGIIIFSYNETSSVTPGFYMGYGIV